MSFGLSNFYKIKDSKFSQLTDTFISLYNNILEYPQDKMRKGIVKPLPRIGYMVYEKYLKENGYDDILDISAHVKELLPVVRLLHTEPYLELPEFDYAKFTRFGIHKDSGANFNPSASINWPLINCDENSITKWYNITSGEPIVGPVYTDADHCEVEEVESTSLINNQPVLFRVDQFHSVDNYTEKKRVIAAWHFKEEVSWDRAVDIMRELNAL